MWFKCFSLAMQCIALVRQPSHHEKDQSTHCLLCLFLQRLAFGSLKSQKSMPNSGTRRTFGRELAGQETLEEIGHTLVCGPDGDAHECSGIWLMRFQEHSWQLTKCCGKGGSSWGLEESWCDCYPHEGQDRGPSETQASLPHSWEGVGAISLTKHFQTSKGQEGGWK